MVLNIKFVDSEKHIHIYDYESLSDKAVDKMDYYLSKFGIVRYKDIIIGEPEKLMKFLYEFTKANEVYIE